MKKVQDGNLAYTSFRPSFTTLRRASLVAPWHPAGALPLDPEEKGSFGIGLVCFGLTRLLKWRCAKGKKR